MKNSEYLTVGEVSKILGVNRDTILYYDREGVISSIREDNNYRYYHKNQITIFKIILNLKKIGFSLKEIKKTKKNIRSGNYSDVISLMKKREKSILDDIEKMQKDLKLLKNNKKMVEYMSEISSMNPRSIKIDDENYRILIKQNEFFCVKELEEERCIFIDIHNHEKDIEEYTHSFFENTKNAKNLIDECLCGFIILKENFENLEDKKDKFILRKEIDIYKDKYVFPKGKYAVLYLKNDITDKEAIEIFNEKLKENNYIPCGDLYIENSNIFDEKMKVEFINLNKTKLKMLKILIKN